MLTSTSGVCETVSLPAGTDLCKELSNDGRRDFEDGATLLVRDSDLCDESLACRSRFNRRARLRIDCVDVSNTQACDSSLCNAEASVDLRSWQRSRYTSVIDIDFESFALSFGISLFSFLNETAEQEKSNYSPSKRSIVDDTIKLRRWQNRLLHTNAVHPNKMAIVCHKNRLQIWLRGTVNSWTMV